MKNTIVIFTAIFLICLGSQSYGQVEYLLDQFLPDLIDSSGSQVYSSGSSSDVTNVTRFRNTGMLINSIDYRIYYRQWTNGINDIDLSSLAFTSYVNLPNSADGPAIIAGYRKRLFTTQAEFKDNGIVNQSFDKNELFFSISSDLPAEHSKLSLNLTGNNDDYHFGLLVSGYIHLLKPIRIKTGFKQDNYSFPLLVSYESSQIAASLPIESNRLFIEAGNSGNDKWSGNIYLAYSAISDGRKHHKDNFDITTDGSSLDFKSSLKYNLLPGLAVGLNSSIMKFSENFDFYESSLKFARFGKLDYNSSSWAATLTYEYGKQSDLLLRAASTKTDFYLRGHLDTWPFAEMIEQMIGAKVYLKTRGDIRMKDIKFDLNHRQWRNPELSFRSGYTRIEPDGFFSTWNPAFLGMGVMNRKTYNDRIKYMDIMSLGLGINYSVKRYMFSYSIQQYLPVSIRKDRALESDSGSGESSSDTRTTSFGGSFHRFSVGLYF
ncbi:MAG: hypothetical protein GY839_11240 [candidate division Zixibacteria bacterium]|nr:hypothetical protein [candidate division Zixibacteria bacterium]